MSRRHLDVALVAASALLASAGQSQSPDFARDIEPILRERCHECHGPRVQRKSLRLDSRDAARRGGRSGPALVPGNAGASLLMQHVTAAGGKRRMPAAGPPLPDAAIAALRDWIDQGAEWPDDEPTGSLLHWAYRPINAPAPPPVRDEAWVRNDIDRFVLAELERMHVEPSPAADRATWLRRVSLDLIGLPPTPAAIDAFVVDDTALARERAVDQLLASPQFGERWARMWLDLARYADTKGYEKDARRSIWRYRDWVIRAFDADMPFDQFTVQQLAGDLLPDGGDEPLIATAFHRNTMTNDEGGTDDEEFRVEAVHDRVATTAQVWMGTTLGCARCHDHKYDPFAQRDYYALFAFFDTTQDADHEDERPTITVYPPQRRDEAHRLTALLARQRALLDGPLPELDAAQQAWAQAALAQLAAFRAAPPVAAAWSIAGPFAADSAASAFTTAFAPEQPGAEVPWTAHSEWVDGQVHALPSGGIEAFYLRRGIRAASDGQVVLSLGSDDGLVVWLNGEQVFAHNDGRGAALDQNRVRVALRAGDNELLLKVVNHGGQCGFAFRVLGLDAGDDVVAALEAPARTEAQTELLTQRFREQANELAPLRAAVAALEAQLAAIGSTTVPILREQAAEQRRTTRLHVRGSFLHQGEVVAPGTPAILPPLPDDVPRDRLALARWLVSPQHPLTARVIVNRFWEELFGRGLVATSADFGTQSDPPTHPELLDWLAHRFVADGWSVKQLLRLIVTSATYGQSSRERPELAARDPDNTWLWRGPRHRLAAETLRDQALCVSGLLSAKKFGPSVMPPQPAGLWQIIYSDDQWVEATGDDRYRRGLYTFWRRTNAYPAFLCFDAPSRETCTSRRVVTNTPLQALVTLNDTAYVEAAQALARRMLSAGADAPARAAHGLRLCVGRTPQPAEVDRLVALFATARTHYAAQPDAAVAFATQPLGPLPPGIDATDAAAWTVVANVLLNLDEVLTNG